MRRFISTGCRLLAIVALFMSFVVQADEVGSILFGGVGTSSEVTCGQNKLTIPKDGFYQLSGIPLSESTVFTVAEQKGYRFKGWYGMAESHSGNQGPDISWIGTDSFATSLSVEASEIAANAAKYTFKVYGSTDYYVVYLKFVPLYEISLKASPEGAGIVSGGGSYEAGTEVTLRMTKTNDGYTFSHWENDQGKLVSSDATYVFSPTASANYTAVFNSTAKTVLLEKCGGSGGTDSVVVTNNLPLPRVTPPTKTGYNFQGYFTSASGDGAKQYYNSSGVSQRNWSADETSTTLYARWTANSYAVHFNANGGAGEMSDLTCVYDTPTNLTTCAFTKTGYAFAGWATSAGGNIAYEDGASVSTLAASGEVTLYAQWTAIKYAIRFDANDGDGTMPDLVCEYDQKQVLASNAFERIGYTFMGWATSESGAVVYTNGETVKNLTDAQDGMVMLYAQWRANAYQVAFSGNGGTNQMAVVIQTYGIEWPLPANQFLREGFDFAGWATDPTNAVAFVDQAVVSNLTSEVNGLICLYAKWTPQGMAEVSDWSKALDCDNLNFVPDADDGGWSIVSDGSPVGGTCLKVKVEQSPDAIRSLSGKLMGAGELTFKYKTSICDAPTDSSWEVRSDWASSFSFEVNGVAMEESRSSCLDWKTCTYQKTTAGEAKVQWRFWTKNPDIGDESDSDNDYALLDSVTWVPDKEPDCWVGVTLRRNDGTISPDDIVTNLSCLAGEAIGDLPVLEDSATLGAFSGWGEQPTSSAPLANAWIVPAQAEGVQLYALWGLEPPSPSPMPTDADRVTISSSALVNGCFVLSFKSDERFDYRLLTNANLRIDSWGLLMKLPGNGAVLSFEPEIIEGLPQLFYKVETVQKQ